MPLTEQEELELLELEEQEYQASQAAKAPSVSSKNPKQMSKEEIDAADRQIAAEQDKAALQAGLTGALQGATFGFSDELGAAGDVALDTLKGNVPQKIYDKFREYQKTRESANKKLEEESPKAYLGGEVVGGLASAFLVPGLGEAKAASIAGKLSPRLARLMTVAADAEKAKELSAGGRILGKAATDAIQGIPLGAAYGLGSSEHNIDQPVELGKDVASSAGMGSLTGLGIGAIGQGGKELVRKGKDFVKDSDFLRQVGKSYEYGSEKGINLGSSAAQDAISLVPGERAMGLVNKIEAIDAEIGKKVGNAIKSAQDSGVKIDISPELQAAHENLTKTLFIDNPTLGQLVDPKSAKLLQTIGKQEATSLTPLEAKALKDELFSLKDKLAGYNSDQANFSKKLASDLGSSIDQELKSQVPEYAQAAREFEQFRRLVPETIISKGTPEQLGKVYMGDLKNPELKLFESSKDMLKKAKLPGEAASEGRATMEQLRLNLEKLQQKNPEAVKKLGGTAEEVINQLKGTSDELAMIRQAQGFDPQEGPKGVLGGALSGIVTTGRGLTMSVANKAGLASKAAKSVGQTAPVKMSTELFAATDDALMNLAQSLKGNKATEILGNSLENSLNNKNDAGKKAVLFKLMQNPDYRNMLRPYMSSENENE